jgi:hypothetical protein
VGVLLERRTPLKKKRATPRRKPRVTCSVRGCNNSPRDLGLCPKHLRLEADKLFGAHIRAKGRCWYHTIRQGCSGATQAAHLVSRRYMAVRWEDSNCVPLCQGAHMYLTHHPIEHLSFAEGLLGPTAWHQLRDHAMNGSPMDPVETIQRLRGEP